MRAVEYAGYWVIQTKDYYHPYDNLAETEHYLNAEANALLMASAPELLADTTLLQQENERLRGLMKTAYHEGYNRSSFETDSSDFDCEPKTFKQFTITNNL